ncbi:T9SS sorting signal type C domain-containing protein [Flavobacterium panici]|nr:T9SS sorting signal type C domain-containing protein [Flavobacterium panici]
MRFSHLLFAGLFSLFSVNLVGAQAASSTWALTANGNATTVTGNVTSAVLAIGSGIDTPVYSTAAGVSTSGWASSTSRQTDEYYEFKVTPTTNNIFNVTAINFEHSRSTANLTVQAYYSTDNFATSTAIASSFTSNSSTPAANNNTVNIPVNGTTLTVRIYAWSNSGTRNLRVRNVVISGTTCAKANAGVDQYSNNPSFTLAANTPTTGTGTWSIASGPNTSASQFASLTNPTTTFTPIGSGTWVLNWTINSCNSSTDQVVITNCSGNLITNGDFSNTAVGWTAAVNSKGPVSATSYVEVLTESVYFSNGNSDNTAELDSEASLGQTVTVIPNVPYTLSFLYARRPGSPASVAVDVRIIGAASPTSINYTTSDTNSTPQIGTFTFTPTSSSIVIEFYNSLGTTTLGAIIDNIVLVPSSQVVPVATTIPKGSYKTLTVCIGASVTLDVDNISTAGVTYAWSASAGAAFSSTSNIKSPTATFSTSGLKQFTVTATNAGGCGNISSTTFVNVIDLPVVYNVTGGGSYCSGSTGLAVGLNNSTTGVNYQLKMGGTDIGTAVAGTGSAISFGSQTVAGTYTIVATNATGCTSNMSGSAVITVSALPIVSITGSSNICAGSTTTLSPTSGGTWVSNNPAVASVTNTGIVTSIAAGSATFTFTNIATPNCSATTGTVTVSSLSTVFNSSSTYNVPAGVTSLQVECWGGGGSGGAASVNPSAGGGGAGGAYVKNTSISVTPNSTYTVTVGSGGTVSTSASGGQGGSSWFGSTTTILATGGNGGVLGNGTTANGAGATAITTGNVGGTATNLYGLGGGSASGTGTGRTAGSGSAGANGGGTGGVGTTTNANGAIGNTPGGGGAGGRNTSGTARSGGIGGTGRVIITISTPTASAGGSQTICQTGTALVSGANATNGTIAWTHNGAGTLTNTTTLTPTYAAAPGDAGNTVTLTMTVSNGPCVTQATATYTVIVNALPVITTHPQPIAVCEGKNHTFTIATSTGSPTYQWQYSPDNATWTNTDGAAGVTGHTTASLNVANIPLSYSGNYVHCIITVGTCSITSNSALLTVNPTPTAPTASVTTQPTCAVPTATITVSSPAPAAGITYSIDGTTYTNTTGIFTGVATGSSYNVTTKNSSGCESPITVVTVNTYAGKTWNGSVSTNWNVAGNWTPSGVPTVDDCVVIPDLTSIANKPEITGTNIEYKAHSINLNNNSSFIVRSTNTLTVTNAVTVNTGSTLTFENNASLVQTTNAVNSGNITYLRSTTPVNRYDYVYWSVPVTATPGITLHDLSPTTLADKYQSFNPTSGWVISYNGTQVMTPGQGYIVRGPQENVSAAVFQASFTGVPNNGDFTITPVATKWHLIGNPYPSAISANKLITDAGTGALYFWTHTNQPDENTTGNETYNYDPDDYSVYTLSGSTGTSNGPAASGKIAAGQGFFFKASTGNNVVFTNSMRIPGENSQFFKTAADIERNRVWLNMSTTRGLFKQALIGYIEGATNSWDQNYDAATLNGSAYLDFYSLNEAKKLTIQGRGLPFEDTDLVPLGYKTSVAGEFTIAIDHTDGLLNDQAVYLEDKVTSKVHDLKAGNYKFNTEIGTFTDRFVLRYTNKTLGTGDFENVKDGLLVSVKDKAIKVTSSKENIKEVSVFDITGKLLYNKKKVETTEFSISNLQAAEQVLLVKVTLENKAEVTRKIIFK